jgi:alkyl hydroperoxide reductase subunit AhpC
MVFTLQSLPWHHTYNNYELVIIGVMHDDGHPIRGLFIIDPKGILRHATLNDPPVGRNVEECLRVIQACQVGPSYRYLFWTH